VASGSPRKGAEHPFAKDTGAIEVWPDPADNLQAEVAYRILPDFLVEEGLRRPEPQHEIFGPDGRLIARVDFYWDEHKRRPECHGTLAGGAGSVGASDLKIGRTLFAMFQNKGEDFRERGGGQGNATVGRAVIEPQLIRIWPVNHAAGKHNTGYVSHELVVLPRTEHPFGTTSPYVGRLFKIEKC